MKRVVLAAAACVAALIAACSSDAPASKGEEGLRAMVVKCRAEAEPGASFDLLPVDNGGTTVLEGTLTDEKGAVTSYMCRPVPSTGDAGAASVESIATCDPTQPSRATVELVRDGERNVVNARIEQAALVPGEASAETTLACATVLLSTVVPSYTAVAPYIQRSCDGCHVGKFDSLDKVKAQQRVMLGQISSGAMPQRDPTWRDTPEGKAVIAFLAKSNELN